MSLSLIPIGTTRTKKTFDPGWQPGPNTDKKNRCFALVLRARTSCKQHHHGAMAPPQTNIQHKTQPKNKKSYKYNVAIFIIKIIQMLLCSHIILNLNYLQHYNNTANIQSPLQFLPQSREKNKKIKLFDEKKTQDQQGLPSLLAARVLGLAHRSSCRAPCPPAS